MMKIADIIHLSWKVYTSKLKQYLPLLLIAFFLSTFTNLITYILVDVMQLFSKYVTIISVTTSFIASMLGIFITILVINYNDKFLNNKKIDFTFKDALPVFWPTLWISFIVGIITFLGYIFFIIPGVLFTVWYAFILFVIILEKKTKFKEVLGTSKSFSKERFWPVLARILVPNFFWTLIGYLVLIGMLNILGLLTNSVAAEMDPSKIGVGIGIIVVTSLVSSFFLPLYLLVGNIVYNEVKK